MSRLIVKNLPPGITEKKFKEIFSAKGLVTDVQLKYTKEGKFRRFGFVGYKTEEQAKEALAYFDKTCIETARIIVESCAGLGDPSKPKAWSKYAPDSSAHSKLVQQENPPDKEKSKETKLEKKEKKKSKKITDNEEVKKALEKHKNDPLFSEFLETHAAKGVQDLLNTSSKSDDEKHEKDTDDEKVQSDNGNDENINEESIEKTSEEKVASKAISDLEYMKALKNKNNQSTEVEKSAIESTTHGSTKFFTVKIRGLGYNHKKKHIKQFFHPLKAKSIRVPQKIKGIAYVGFKTERHMNQALNKNKSFLEGKRIFVCKYEGEEKKQSTNLNDKESNPRWKQQQDALKNEETIAESGRIYVRNLSYVTTEDELRKIFEKYGPLVEVNLPIDKISRKPKGFGTITFMMPEHAVRAYSELDGTALNGRMLHLLPGKAKPSEIDINTEGLSFKEKKEIERRGMANSKHNWNTLFLGSNAVADAIASSYNTTKENVLQDTGNGTSVAVRLALGETQLVEETRKFLEENGVVLDAFNQPSEKRSNTVILVKNLPSDTKTHELREKFAVHGELGRVLMPPSGITALVEFLEPSEARKAFARLAYTKFKHLPLYLEWAPDNSLTPSTKKKNGVDKSSIQSKNKDKNVSSGNTESLPTNESPESKDDQNDEDDEDEPEPNTTLFVKNLNFSTTDETLKKYFSKCGAVHYANVATKKDPNNPGEKLSMGYGFVRYKYKMDTDRALKQLQMTELEGKTLELKRSERTLKTDVATARKTSNITAQTGTKILIKNIPFQANASEITELFKAFGELKAVRLPKKMVGDEKHRGFGFVEYFTKNEAKRAFKTMCQSTHLYGRRLVLEWAQAVEDVADIRKRTAKHFHQEVSSKRSKKAVIDPESVGLAAE
ncbi:hypothetical protein PV326_012614 [Microctonus aethiopoides]|nr:hypothetical protein PV326_012614 [Microctonus aethiopoides]